tara:strand:- start:6478 stop:8130 length:1653 start_codon:yes stop_codon:yes gene_type:complete
MNYLFIALQGIKTGLGTGHVSRVKRILNNLGDDFYRDNSVNLLSNCPAENESEYKLLTVNTIDECKENIKKIIKEKKADFVVFDTLDYFQDTYSYCANQGIISIGIDTASEQSKYLDLLINPVIKNNYSYLNGPEFSIHYEESKLQKTKKNKKSIFVCFGGLDHKDYFINIYESLEELSLKYEVNVVLSENNKDFLTKKHKKINFFYRPSNFYEILKSSDIAIISGGIMLQETTYLGIPSIVLPQYDHQRKIALQRKEEGSIIDVFHLQQKNVLVDFIEECLNSDHVNDISLKSRSFDDGFGIRRFISALNIYDYMEWDSSFFKKEIYQLNFKKYTENINNLLNVLCSSNQVDLIYYLCPSDDSKSIDFAKKNNFKVVDTRITFSLTYKKLQTTKLKENAKIVISCSDNLSRLEEIARNAKWTSRYYNDDNFKKNDLKTFYAEWVKKSVEGKLDDMVFHVEFNDEICGFISVKKQGINYGSIGLIAVDENFQGYGFGTALISYASKYMFDVMDCAKVVVVTQEDNIGACTAYGKIGFQISDKSYWMHKWV